MKYFFPDSQDFVDPSFDMITEERRPHRIRQQDDLYPHEIFPTAPYDGMLVSMAIVQGSGAGPGKYTIAQRARFLRQGVRAFLRLPKTGKHLETFGDCGAFSYFREEAPPFSAEDAFEFYEGCGFDYGISVDHVIPVYRPALDQAIPLKGMGSEREKWGERQALTLELASAFITICRTRKATFIPVGAAQGWSPSSYTASVNELQRMGYEHIALGGMVPLKTDEILESLRAVAAVRKESTRLHLLGVTRLEAIPEFKRLGVYSFDSTAPLMRAFKDKRHNYYLGARTFSAIRVPQLEGNPRFRRRVLSGEVDADHARELERRVLGLLQRYEADEADLESVLDSILQYETLFDPEADREQDYRQVLLERPWERCDCEICSAIGIHVILFRGSERNRRRGFHNLREFYRSLSDISPVVQTVRSPKRA